MTATATEVRPFAIGDPVSYRYAGQDYTGTIRGTYRYERTGVDGTDDNTQPDSVLISGAGYSNLRSVRSNVEGYGGELASRYTLDTDTSRDGEEVVWVSVESDRVRHVEPETPALSESAAQVTALEATVSDLREQVSTAHDVVRIIAEHMKQEAEDRDWCETFESVVDKIDRALPSRGGFDATFTEAAKRAQDFTVRFYGTHTVTAFDADEARAYFRDLDHGDLAVDIDYVQED